MNINELLVLKRSSNNVRKLRKIMHVVLAILLLLLVVFFISYTYAYFYIRRGAFTINIDKKEMLKVGMSLSEHKVFDRPINQLYATAIENIDNISGLSIPADVDGIDGDHNGTNYIAYTFYFKNTGDSSINYTAAILIDHATLGIEHAVRVKLYTDGVPVTYAKLKRDGTGPEPGTMPFSSDILVDSFTTNNYAPGSVTKYTIVLWLEGDDPECVDDIMGGTLKMQMRFNGEKVGDKNSD